jgi:hypothetical protein
MVSSSGELSLRNRLKDLSFREMHDYLERKPDEIGKKDPLSGHMCITITACE